MKVENYIISAILGFCIGVLLTLFIMPVQRKSVQTEFVVKTETRIVRDTITITTPKCQDRIVRDTIWLRGEDAPEYLLVEQKMYSDSLYSAWISGVNPSLDSIRVYSRTQYVDRVVERNVIQEQPQRDLFVGVGADVLNKDVIPKVQATYRFKRIAIGGNVGIYKNKPIYGISFNYKIK